jgi:hypothetical protein
MMQADSTAQPGNASGSQILPPWSSMQVDLTARPKITNCGEMEPPLYCMQTDLTAREIILPAVKYTRHGLICGEIRPRRRIQPLNDISAAVGYTRHCKHTQTVLTARVLAPGPGWRPSPAAINCEHRAGRYGRKQPEEQVVQQELQYIS